MHAMRIVLNLYKEAITLHGGIGQNRFADEFDAFKFLRCKIDASIADQIVPDVNLLHQGSSVSLLCRLCDAFRSNGEKRLHQNPLAEKIMILLRAGAFDDVPSAKEAVFFAFLDRDIFLTKLQFVYEEYVLGYFYNILSVHNKITAHPPRPLVVQ